MEGEASLPRMIVTRMADSKHTFCALLAVGEDRVMMMLWSVPFWSNPYSVAVGLLSLRSKIPSLQMIPLMKTDKVVSWMAVVVSSMCPTAKSRTVTESLPWYCLCTGDGLWQLIAQF